MKAFITDLKQKLVVFGVYIILFIYNIYTKFFEKDNVQKSTTKKTKNITKGVKKSNMKTAKPSALKLFKAIESLNNDNLLEKLLTINPNVVDQQDEQGNTPLMSAIQHQKNEKVISKLLSYTSDINAKNANGDNCLMLAIENGNKDLVDLLLQYNPNVNTQNTQGETPLFLAIAKDNTDIVTSLLSKNVNLSIRNQKGQLPIEIALANEDMELIKMLIEAGATTLVKDLDDEYVLFQIMNRPDLLKDVLELESQSPNKKNLILTLRNKQGYTLFMEFCRLGYQKLAKFMMKHKADLNEVNRGENALTIAVREEQLDMVKLLLTCRGIDVHHITNDNKTPLRIAIEHQNIPIIKTLINYGGPLLLKNENENLLRNAINTSNIDIVRLLLDININVDVKFGHEKNTPLIYTIKKALKDMNIDTSEDENINFANTLGNEIELEKGVDDDRMSVSSSSSSASTLAIHKSSSITDSNYYSRVFSNMEDPEGRDPSFYDSDDTLSDAEDINNKKSNKSRNSEEESEDRSSDQSFTTLLTDEKVAYDQTSLAPISEQSSPIPDHKSFINTDSPSLNHRSSFEKKRPVKDRSIVVEDSYCDILKVMLRYHAKVNLTNSHHDTALILACRYGLKNVVETLLEENRNRKLNLDMNLFDKYGNTALHNACKKNYTSIVRLLLAEEATNVNITNKNGNTALMLAVYENNLEIIHELLKRDNININTLNVQLETPLIAACRMNNYKVAKILLDHDAIINKRYDLNGETAIFHAIRNNNKKLTALLLENDASVSFKNKNGKSPLTIAKEYKYKGIISLLFAHFKNQSMLKNKNSTLSLNENLVRTEDKKAFFHNPKTHTRNASINVVQGSPASSSATSHANSSIISELKNSNKPSLKINHKRTNSNIPLTRPLISNSFTNTKHTRHESFNNNEDSLGKSNTVRFNNHTRHKSFNPELLSGNKLNKIDKHAKAEGLNRKGEHETRPRSRSYSNSDRPVKKGSNFNLRKSFQTSKMNSYDEPESADETSDTEITTQLLLKKAKEKVEKIQNEAINSSTNLTHVKASPKSSRGQSNSKSEPKPDDYLKPLKTACYNQNNEDIEKFYEDLVQDKGNVYKLPEDLFQQVQKCRSEEDWAKVIPKIKEFNKTRPTTPTSLSLDMFAFTLLYFSDNAKAIETMLKYGLNPNMQNNAYYTLLILACKKSQPKSALVLLDYNADPNYQNKYDETALILACKKGLDDVIERLLQCHANVNLRNDKGETALIMACWKKNLKIVKRLLETNVDVNMKNNLEESPLFLSCLQNSLDIAEVLLKHGADVNASNQNHETPLMVARKNENKEMIDLLLKYGAKEN